MCLWSVRYKAVLRNSVASAEAMRSDFRSLDFTAEAVPSGCSVPPGRERRAGREQGGAVEEAHVAAWMTPSSLTTRQWLIHASLLRLAGLLEQFARHTGEGDPVLPPQIRLRRILEAWRFLDNVASTSYGKAGLRFPNP